ncbi:hypothetical protein Hanom_Chr02g00152871 [Helianthus anomalus]
MAALPSYGLVFYSKRKKKKKCFDWLKKGWPTISLPPSSGVSSPIPLLDLGPRGDGGGVPDRGMGSPIPLPASAPYTLIVLVPLIVLFGRNRCGTNIIGTVSIRFITVLTLKDTLYC